MAAEPFTTTRRTLLGAAAALPIAALPAAVTGTVPERGLSPSHDPARTLWSRRLAAYRRLAARTKEVGETGFYRQALDRYDREVAAIERRFGGRTIPEARRLIRAAFERVDAVEEAFYDRCTAPMQRAAVRLALTRPPSLKALVEKIRVMHEQELDELGSMPEPVLEMLAGDVARLISG